MMDDELRMLQKKEGCDQRSELHDEGHFEVLGADVCMSIDCIAAFVVPE
jgi:hypothetical protein